jgi:2-dehydropantoate 2-reductase
MAEALRVAVLGPGGVGGLLGALLARDGHQVTCLARPATAGHLLEAGLTLHSAMFGDSHERVGATSRLTDPVDVVVVTVKATHLEAALDLLPAETLGDALVVPFLNGLEHVTLLRSVYPPHQVATATIRVEAERTAPGVIDQRSPFAIVELAAGQADPARVELVAAALSAAGPDVTVHESERQILWDKLSVLAPLALFTTTAAAPFGAVRGARWDDVVAMVGEIADAAAAEGVTVDRDRITRFLGGIPEGMRSSMQKDAAAGLPLELDAIGGSVLRAARAAGTAAPVTARMVAGLEHLAGGAGQG